MNDRKNIGFLNKKRFVSFEKQRITNLRTLTIKKSIKIMEGLLNSGIIEEYKKSKNSL